MELPAHAAIALFLGLGIAWVLRKMARAGAESQVVCAYTLGVCLLQFVIIVYNPRLQVPFRSEQWAADRLASTIANLQGEVFAPDLDGYTMRSDKGEQPHFGAAEELWGSYGGEPTTVGRRWTEELDGALRERRYSYVVATSTACCEILKALDRNGYVLQGPLLPPTDDYWLWTTGRTPNNLLLFARSP